MFGRVGPQGLVTMAAVAVVVVASAAAAQERRALTVDLGKLFPYLEAYRDLAPAARNRFRLAYNLNLQGAPLAALKVAYVKGAARDAVSIAGDGRIAPLPTPQMFADKTRVEISAPKGSKLKLDMQIEPMLAPATEMDARELALAVAQAGDGVKKAGGVFGFAAPKMQRVTFRGAAGGVGLGADGRAAPLKTVKGAPVFDPAAQPGVRRLRFTRAPTRMEISPAS